MTLSASLEWLLAFPADGEIPTIDFETQASGRPELKPHDERTSILYHGTGSLLIKGES
jgi:hypothetical protein